MQFEAILTAVAVTVPEFGGYTLAHMLGIKRYYFQREAFYYLGIFASLLAFGLGFGVAGLAISRALVAGDFSLLVSVVAAAALPIPVLHKTLRYTIKNNSPPPQIISKQQKNEDAGYYTC